MPPCWEGKRYKLISSEFFDEYMCELGIGLVLRKMGNTYKPVVELKEANGKYTFATILEEQTHEFTFKLNQEFVQDTYDGRTVKSIVELNGNTMVQTQTNPEMIIKIIREFYKDKMVATYYVNDIRAVQYYEALK